MAKFVYSMQNILDMKEKLERQEKNDYSGPMSAFWRHRMNWSG